MSLIIDHVTGVRTSPVLKDISFDVQPGDSRVDWTERSRKSTTIKHIIGLLEASKGTIEINHLSLKKIRKNIANKLGIFQRLLLYMKN